MRVGFLATLLSCGVLAAITSVAAFPVQQAASTPKRRMIEKKRAASYLCDTASGSVGASTTSNIGAPSKSLYQLMMATTSATMMATFMCCSSPPAALAADVTAGAMIFNANCAACHRGGQNVIMPEKTLEKEALEKYLAGGRTSAAIIYQITNGKNAMPAFGGRLSDEDIANAASFVMASSEVDWSKPPDPLWQEAPNKQSS